MAGERDKMSAAARAIASLEAAQAEEPSLESRASQLLTFNGYINALSDLSHRAKDCNGSRDEISSMNVEVKVLKMFTEIHTKILEHQLDTEGTRKLQELLDQIGRRESGATTSFPGDFDPPKASSDKGTN